VYVYKDQEGNEWSAVVDPRSVRKDGKLTFGNFCVLCPMPSYRVNIRILKTSSKLSPNSAKET
jgi:hypothetical protein